MPPRWLEEQADFYEADAVAVDAWQQSLLNPENQGPDAVAFRDKCSRIEEMLGRLGPRGRTLELAAGTGAFSALLTGWVDELVLVDTSPTSLARAGARLEGSNVRPRAIMADVFGWEWTEGRFDTICFAAWLHHVPEGCFDDFWSRIDRWLAPDGLVLFDFAVADGPAAVASEPPVAPTESYAAYHDPERAVSVRDLGGRRWRVIHELWDPRELAARLGRLGWELRIEMEDPAGFHWASARRTAGPPASVRRDG